jgi:hypothetical protein
MKPVLVIDGNRFDDFESWAREVGQQLLQDERCNGNLDAFNDILRGGFGTPEGGFVLAGSTRSGPGRSLGTPQQRAGTRRT